ncbi:MAG TPA: tetratricopeptide repeat protein, partial [Thermoanaerobaculia bacterium]|nr:tetratricopeptide repeat protein [Thermoanaerobaculia bacterium]
MTLIPRHLVLVAVLLSSYGAAGASTPDDAQRAFFRASDLLQQQKAGATREAIAQFETALSAYRRLQDRRREAETLHALGIAKSRLTRHRDAIADYEKALAIRHELHDEEGEAMELDGIGFAHEAVSDLAKARETFEQALAIYRRLGNRRGEARQLTGLGAVLPRLGKSKEAFDALNAALL